MYIEIQIQSRNVVLKSTFCPSAFFKTVWHVFLGSILINRNRSSVFNFLTQREQQQQQQQHEQAYKTLDKCLKHAKRFYFYAQTSQI